MKNNGQYNGFTKLKGEPGDNIHQAWANYYIKFIELLRQQVEFQKYSSK